MPQWTVGLLTRNYFKVESRVAGLWLLFRCGQWYQVVRGEIMSHFRGKLQLSSRALSITSLLLQELLFFWGDLRIVEVLKAAAEVQMVPCASPHPPVISGSGVSSASFSQASCQNPVAGLHRAPEFAFLFPPSTTFLSCRSINFHSVCINFGDTSQSAWWSFIFMWKLLMILKLWCL